MKSWDDGNDEDDDNVLFAELRRQVLELTEEDDKKSRIFNSKEGKIRHSPSVLQPQCRFEWIISEDSNKEVPKYLVDLWNRGKSDNGECNGTGVFIPKRSSTSKRKGCIQEKKAKSVLHPHHQWLLFSWISEYRDWVFIGTGVSVPPILNNSARQNNPGMCFIYLYDW